MTRSLLSKTPWERANLRYDMFALHTIWNQVWKKEKNSTSVCFDF